MSTRMCVAGIALAFAGAASAEITVTPEFVRSFAVGAPEFSTRANPNAYFSNVDTFSGSVTTNGGATNFAGNVMTRMVVDDLTLTGPQTSLTRLSFSVANLNTGTNTTARARIRLYADDNGGQPGTLITGVTTTTMTLGPSSVSMFVITVPAVAVPGKLWAGILFDNNGGLTGAGVAELNNLGQGVFNPPAIGSSQDLYFRTSAAGSFLGNNPPGGAVSGGAGPVGNFAWELVPSPGAAGVLGMVGLVALRRRR